MTIAPFPHQYVVAYDSGQLSAPPRSPIRAGAPPQFGGSDDVWSPEELLVGATLECLWTTFDAFAQRDGLAVADWSGTGVAILNRGPRVPVFTSFTLQVELSVEPGNEEHARKLLAKAEQHCIVSYALNVPVTITATVRADPNRSSWESAGAQRAT